MLDHLITSRTRIKLLVKFFSNKNSQGYLRNLASEFNESTNSIRVELNKLSKAGYLKSEEEGRTIVYRANENHPIFPELQAVVRKYLGLDKLVSDLVKKLGEVKKALVVGDYAEGKDTGIIDLVLVGEINVEKLDKLVKKVEKLINRKVRYLITSEKEFKDLESNLLPEKAIWLWEE